MNDMTMNDMTMNDVTRTERQASGFSPRSERTGWDGLSGGRLPSVATTVPNSSFAIRQLEPSTEMSGDSPSRLGVREVGALLNESAQADAVGHGRPVEGIPAINGGEDVNTTAPAAGTAPASWEADLHAEALTLLAQDRTDVWDVLCDRFETTLIQAALATTRGRRIEAAHKLGIGRNTITRKIQELGLDDAG